MYTFISNLSFGTELMFAATEKYWYYWYTQKFKSNPGSYLKVLDVFFSGGIR